MVKEDGTISITLQCEIVSISRSGFYYHPVPEFSQEDIQIMTHIDEIYTSRPYYGYRRQYDELVERGYKIGEDRVRKLMEHMGLRVFYPKKKTSNPNNQHKIYPYLLKDMNIDKPCLVWCADITYIRLSDGFCYLMTIMDWYSRYVLSWRLSNTLEDHFCIAALEDALRLFPHPQIFNTDQGSQFTGKAFTQVLISNTIQISMDGVGRWADNVIIERFFRSIKWEDIYLNDYDSVKNVRLGIANYILFYNTVRKHSSLNKQTPYNVFISLN